MAHVIADQLKAAAVAMAEKMGEAATASADRIETQAEALAHHLGAQRNELAAALNSVEDSAALFVKHCRAVFEDKINSLDALIEQVRAGTAIMPPASSQLPTGMVDQFETALGEKDAPQPTT